MIVAFWYHVARLLLWLRYRIRIRGVGEAASRGTSGILFLPNHPALIDPIVMATQLYGTFHARPLADRDQIDRPLIRGLARRIRALPIPDLAKAGSAASGEVREVVARCVEALRAGDNLILYPSGRNQRSRLEDIGGNSAVETILRELPGVRVVLVRMHGLWGSSFSWASGRPPTVGGALKHGTLALLASGIFFGPRREVSIELVEPADLPRQADRQTLNRFLEAFYNAGARPNTYVPYTPWERGGAREMPEPSPRRPGGDLGEVPEATRRIVREYLTKLCGQKDFGDEAVLARDLGLDSLSRADLLLWLQAEFGFAAGDVAGLVTVGDVMLAACGEAASAGPQKLDPVPPGWFERPADPAWPHAFGERTGRPLPLEGEVPPSGGGEGEGRAEGFRHVGTLTRPFGPPSPSEGEGLPGSMSTTYVCAKGLAEMTIAEAFLAQARRQSGAVIVADQASGAKTYRDLVLAVMILKRRIETFSGDRVGIMMPASVAADVLYLATLFAGKTPVMVNWTLGRQNLTSCLDAVGVERVLTAKALVTRLQGQGVDLGDVSERFVYVEELAARVGAGEKLAAWLRSRFWWAELRRARVSQTAVILFTSGSETTPKAVPLTHRNMLANITDAEVCFTLSRRDAILGILPPFHSFGLTTGTVLPLVLGVRAVYYPNPTDGGSLARMIAAYRSTILIGTPTFLGGVVRAATDEEELASLRLVVTGAEKCPERVYQAVARRCPGAEVLEGYGVTECSPIVAVNHQGQAQPGTIGYVMPSLEHAIVDAAIVRRVAAEQEGMLLVRGPSVFAGYLDYAGPSPFVEFEDRSWYRTGDLVTEAADGVLKFSGRLKRFVKLGGEMISLPAIEAVLERRFATDADEGPVLAVAAAPDDDRPEIVLFTTKPADRGEVNALIREAGLSGLHNIRRVIEVKALPLLGTGKTDYRALAARLK